MCSEPDCTDCKPETDEKRKAANRYDNDDGNRIEKKQKDAWLKWPVELCPSFENREQESGSPKQETQADKKCPNRLC
jgi:hypothetical protein